MTTEGVEVRPSRIQGQGLYALRSFAPGEIVLRWDLSKTIAREELALLSAEELRFTHPLADGRILIVQAPERFVNHSCNNNTVVRDYCDVAIVPIAGGDEITSDYGSDGASVSFECQCGNTNCRGIIG